MPADHDNHDVPPFDKDFWEALSRRAETIRNLPVDELPTSDEVAEDDLDVDHDVLVPKEGFWEGVYRRAETIRNLPVDELPTSDEVVDDGDEPLTLVPYKPTLCSFEDAGEFLPTTVPEYREVELVLLELALSRTQDHTLVGLVYATSHELSEHAESVPQVRIGWKQHPRDQDGPAHDAPLESRRWVRWMSADEHESLTLFVVGQASALIAEALGSAESIVDGRVAATLKRHGFDAYVAFRHGLLGRALGALSVLDEPDAPPAFASSDAWTSCTYAICRRWVGGLQLGNAESSPPSTGSTPTGPGPSTWDGRLINATRRAHDPTGWAGRYLQGRASEHVFSLNWLRESGELVLADRGSGKSCFLHHLWWVQSLEDAAVPAPEVVSVVSAERDTSQGAKPEPHSDFVVVLDNLDELHADAALLRQLRWIIPGSSPRGPGQGICNRQNLLATLSMAVFATCSRDNEETRSVGVLGESGSQLVPVSRSDTAIGHPHMYAQIMCVLRRLNDALACSDPGQEEDPHSALPNTGGVLFREHVDKEHLVEWDCWGPVVHYNIVERGDVDDHDGCTIKGGGICMGGTMPDIPDQFMDRRSLGPASRGAHLPLRHVVHRDRVER